MKKKNSNKKANHYGMMDSILSMSIFKERKRELGFCVSKQMIIYITMFICAQ